MEFPELSTFPRIPLGMHSFNYLSKCILKLGHFHLGHDIFPLVGVFSFPFFGIYDLKVETHLANSF